MPSNDDNFSRKASLLKAQLLAHRKSPPPPPPRKDESKPAETTAKKERPNLPGTPPGPAPKHPPRPGLKPGGDAAQGAAKPRVGFALPLPPKKGEQSAKENMNRKGTLLPLGRRVPWKAMGKDQVKGTVFEELAPEAQKGGEVQLDQERIKKAFAKKDPAKKATPKPTTDGPTQKKILDSRKAQNVGIRICRLGEPLPQLIDRMDNLDSSGLSLETIERLQEVLPSAEEKVEFKKFFESGGKVEELRDVEKRLFPLTEVPRAAEACRILAFDLKLPTTVATIEDDCQVLFDAAQEIRTSKRFRHLLVAVLLWGNVINHGFVLNRPNDSKDEGEMRTIGFTLSSLCRLSDFKSSADSSITALHFIIAHMCFNAPAVGIEALASDMPTLHKAVRVTEEVFRESIAYIKKETDFAAAQAKILQTQGDAANAEKVDALATEGNRVHGHVKSRHEDTVQYVISTADYFGGCDEPGGKNNYESFFQTLQRFLMVFKKCLKDVEVSPKKFKALVAESKDGGSPKAAQSGGSSPKESTVVNKSGGADALKPPPAKKPPPVKKPPPRAEKPSDAKSEGKTLADLLAEKAAKRLAQYHTEASGGEKKPPPKAPQTIALPLIVDEGGPDAPTPQARRDAIARKQMQQEQKPEPSAPQTILPPPVVDEGGPDAATPQARRDAIARKQARFADVSNGEKDASAMARQHTRLPRSTDEEDGSDASTPTARTDEPKKARFGDLLEPEPRTEATTAKQDARPTPVNPKAAPKLRARKPPPPLQSNGASTQAAVFATRRMSAVFVLDDEVNIKTVKQSRGPPPQAARFASHTGPPMKPSHNSGMYGLVRAPPAKPKPQLLQRRISVLSPVDEADTSEGYIPLKPQTRSVQNDSLKPGAISLLPLTAPTQTPTRNSEDSSSVASSLSRWMAHSITREPGTELARQRKVEAMPSLDQQFLGLGGKATLELAIETYIQQQRMFSNKTDRPVTPHVLIHAEPEAHRIQRERLISAGRLYVSSPLQRHRLGGPRHPPLAHAPPATPRTVFSDDSTSPFSLRTLTQNKHQVPAAGSSRQAAPHAIKSMSSTSTGVGNNTSRFRRIVEAFRRSSVPADSPGTSGSIESPRASNLDREQQHNARRLATSGSGPNSRGQEPQILGLRRLDRSESDGKTPRTIREMQVAVGRASRSKKRMRRVGCQTPDSLMMTTRDPPIAKTSTTNHYAPSSSGIIQEASSDSSSDEMQLPTEKEQGSLVMRLPGINPGRYLRSPTYAMLPLSDDEDEENS